MLCHSGGAAAVAQPLAKGGSRFNGRRGGKRVVHECADSRNQKERLVVRDTPEREENKGVKGTARKQRGMWFCLMFLVVCCR